MSSKSFETEIFIHAPLDGVLSFMEDFQNHTKTHPLIQAVEELPSQADAPGLRRYRITDRIKMMGFDYTFKYLATITKGQPGELISDAYQPPGVHLQNVTRLTSENGGTRVHETINIDAPGILIGFVFKQAQAAHQGMFSRLKAVLEESAT